jgi:hypothetical protein
MATKPTKYTKEFSRFRDWFALGGYDAVGDHTIFLRKPKTRRYWQSDVNEPFERYERREPGGFCQGYDKYYRDWAFWLALCYRYENKKGSKLL